MVPQTGIYSRYFEYASSKLLITDQSIAQFYNTNHFRLFLGDGIIAPISWLNYSCPILLYDNNITEQKDWVSELEALGRLTRFKISFVHPVIFTKNNIQDIAPFFALKKVSLTNTLVIFDMNLDNTQFRKLFIEHKEEIQQRKRFAIYIDKNYYVENPEKFNIEQLFETLDRFFLCKLHGVHLQAELLKQNNFKNKEASILTGVAHWMNSTRNWDMSLYLYFQDKKQGGAVRILDEWSKQYPVKAGRLFHTRPNQIKEGGYWLYE